MGKVKEMWGEGWIVARYEDKITASYAVPNEINNETK